MGFIRSYGKSVAEKLNQIGATRLAARLHSAGQREADPVALHNAAAAAFERGDMEAGG